MEEGQKDFKRQRTKKTPLRLCFLEMMEGFTHGTLRIWTIVIDILLQKGIISQVPTFDKELQAIKKG